MPGYISIHIVLSIVLYTFELENKHKQQVLELKLLKYLHQISIILISTCALRRIHSIRLSSTQQSHENKTCQKLLWDCPGP